MTSQLALNYPNGWGILGNLMFHKFASCGRRQQYRTKVAPFMVRDEIKSKD